jgi:hypothetical protein
MPYFHELSSRLTEEYQDFQLLDYANKFCDKFYLIPYGKEYDGNQLLRIDDELELPWLLDLRKRIPLTVNKFVIVKHEAGCLVRPHKDRNLSRRTIIATPISPKIDYADTIFWKENKEIARCRWGDKSVILDTQEVHSLINGPETRISFQICLSESFDQVVSTMEN